MLTKDGEKSILEVTRNNYIVPSNETGVYHYKVEKQRFAEESGKRLSHPKICKTGVKLFSTIKRNLELQGYVVEILYAPDGKYVVNTTREDEEPFKRNLVEKVRDEADIMRASFETEIAELKAIIAKQSADNAELKALIKEMTAKPAEKPVEATESAEGTITTQEAEKPVETAENAPKTEKKAGRPAKNK